MIGKFRKVVTNDNGVEVGRHGTEAFPVGIYYNDYTETEAIWHWHQEFEIIHMIEGNLKISLPKEQVILSEGEVLFINSGVMHAAANAGDDTCLFRAFVFQPEFLVNGKEGILWSKYIFPLIANKNIRKIMLSNTVSLQMEEFWNVCEREEFGYEFLVREHLSKLICKVAAQSQKMVTSGGSINSNSNIRVKKMLEYIHHHYGETITMKELADCVNVSESECLRCFRSVLKTTPIQYVKKYRLQKAADMLFHTGDTITEIAGKCGFEHMSYFANSFKKMYGVTPREYKNRI